MTYEQTGVWTAAALFTGLLAMGIAGCQTSSDRMPPPNAQVGTYQSGGGVSNGSYDEYTRHNTGSATGGAAPTTQP